MKLGKNSDPNLLLSIVGVILFLIFVVGILIWKYLVPRGVNPFTLFPLVFMSVLIAVIFFIRKLGGQKAKPMADMLKDAMLTPIDAPATPTRPTSPTAPSPASSSGMGIHCCAFRPNALFPWFPQILSTRYSRST